MMSVPRSRAAALAALFVAGAFAGCIATGHADPELVEAVAGTEPMTWAPGNYWAYTAVFHEETVIDVALIVHELGSTGFHLGSNSSAGFFGLPFTGNVTPSLNPRIGADVWPLFQFPLEDGKTWNYEMFGHSARTTARAAHIDVPGHGPQPGFTFESASYGKVFARYDYSPLTGWFTKLQLIEPTNGQMVLDVTLTAFGTNYDQAYYVEEAIRTLRIAYPDLPGDMSFELPQNYLRISAILTSEASLGYVESRLEDARGRTLLDTRAVGKGADTAHASAQAQHGPWTLVHSGAGMGLVYLEITGLAASGPLAEPPREDAPSLSLAELLARAASEGAPVLRAQLDAGAPVDVMW